MGSSTTDRGPQEKPYGCISLTLMIMGRISWSKLLLGMKLGCTSTVLRQKHNPWHGNIQGLPPSKNSRYQPALGNWWWLRFGTRMVCFCCTFLLLMKVNSAAYQATLKKLKESCSTQEASDVRQEGAVVAWQCPTAYSSYDSESFGTMELGNSWAPALQPRSGTFGLPPLPQHKKTSSCQVIQITWWCQAQGANMAAWSRSHLLSTGFWEMDFLPRQVPQQRRWLCGKISEVKCNKWKKRHLTMWGCLVAIK